MLRLLCEVDQNFGSFVKITNSILKLTSITLLTHEEVVNYGATCCCDKPSMSFGFSWLQTSMHYLLLYFKRLVTPQVQNNYWTDSRTGTFIYNIT